MAYWHAMNDGRLLLVKSIFDQFLLLLVACDDTTSTQYLVGRSQPQVCSVSEFRCAVSHLPQTPLGKQLTRLLFFRCR